MNDDPSDMPGTDRARRLLEASQDSVSDMLTVIGLISERINSDETVSPTEMAKALTVLSQSRNKLIDEVKEHDDRNLFSRGETAAGPLDLEAIRASIGSRLDRIRTALDEGTIS